MTTGEKVGDSLCDNYPNTVHAIILDHVFCYARLHRPLNGYSIHNNLETVPFTIKNMTELGANVRNEQSQTLPIRPRESVRDLSAQGVHKIIVGVDFGTTYTGISPAISDVTLPG